MMPSLVYKNIYYIIEQIFVYKKLTQIFSELKIHKNMDKTCYRTFTDSIYKFDSKIYII